MRVNDIIHPSDGRFLSHTEINEKYDLNASFLDALRIRQSIPGSWRALITPHGRPPDPAAILLTFGTNTTVDIFTASSRSLYAAIIGTMAKVIKSQAKWEMELPGPSPFGNWQLLYKLPFQAARETKFQALQYKILHRVLPCRHYLKTIRLISDEKCAFCPERDTITHFLYDCPNTKLLWSKISDWLLLACGSDLSGISTRDIILGAVPHSREVHRVNFITMFTKHYIQRQKLFHEGSLSLIEWLAEFRKRLLSEKYICALEGKPARFARWDRILQTLG